MTRKQMRSLIFTRVKTFDTSLANIFYENLEGAESKGANWIKASIRFGSSTVSALDQKEDVGVLFIQVFTKKDTGGAIKDGIIDELINLFDYKTLTDLNGNVAFRGGSETIAPKDGEYIQHQYSIPFNNYKEIA